MPLRKQAYVNVSIQSRITAEDNSIVICIYSKTEEKNRQNIVYYHVFVIQPLVTALIIRCMLVQLLAFTTEVLKLGR